MSYCEVVVWPIVNFIQLFFSCFLFKMGLLWHEVAAAKRNNSTIDISDESNNHSDNGELNGNGRKKVSIFFL